MTRTSPTTLAVAADYADAMLVARRAKNVLFLLLLLILLGQIAIFATLRFSPALHVTDGAFTGRSRMLLALFEQFTGAADFLGVVFPIVLSAVLFLIVTIMLVGRLVGVSHVTSAFCWCLVLTVFLFPWQALLNSHAVGEVHAGMSAASQPSMEPSSMDVRIPGALYTWPELLKDYDFPNDQFKLAWLKWWRFAGYPFVMLAILFMIQARSSRGLRFALGEAELHIEAAAPPT